jgi:hypothetical protein
MRQQEYTFLNGTAMNMWSRFIIISLLLLLALAGAVFATLETVQAVRNFQQHHVLARKEDVRIISSWMTISYVSRTYHVPDDYLCHALHVPVSPETKRTTLYVLSMRSHRPINDVIQSTQVAITNYRRQHSPPQPPVRHNTPRMAVIGA